MSDTLDPLIRDLVAWVAKEPRPYAEVLEAWRTSCPRLTVWEDATDRGLVERRTVQGRGVIVMATDAGREFLCSLDHIAARGAYQPLPISVLECGDAEGNVDAGSAQ